MKKLILISILFVAPQVHAIGNGWSTEGLSVAPKVTLNAPRDSAMWIFGFPETNYYDTVWAFPIAGATNKILQIPSANFDLDSIGPHDGLIFTYDGAAVAESIDFLWDHRAAEPPVTIDSTFFSNNLHRIVWGTARGSGSDSSTISERDASPDFNNIIGTLDAGEIGTAAFELSKFVSAYFDSLLAIANARSIIGDTSNTNPDIAAIKAKTDDLLFSDSSFLRVEVETVDDTTIQAESGKFIVDAIAVVDTEEIARSVWDNNIVPLSSRTVTGLGSDPNNHDTLFVLSTSDSTAIQGVTATVEPSGGGAAIASGSTNINGRIIFNIPDGDYDYLLSGQGAAFASPFPITILGDQTDTLFGTPFLPGVAPSGYVQVFTFYITPGGDTVQPTTIKYQYVDSAGTAYADDVRLTIATGYVIEKGQLSEKINKTQADSAMFSFPLVSNYDVFVDGVQDSSSWVQFEMSGKRKTTILIQITKPGPINPYAP